MSQQACTYCGGKGWRWGRAAPSLGEKGYAIKRACGYCPAGKALKAKSIPAKLGRTGGAK
jgi:hypothetical protein